MRASILTSIDENVGLSGASLCDLNHAKVAAFVGLADGNGVDEVIGVSKLIDELMDDLVAVVLVPGQGVARTSQTFAGWSDGWGGLTHSCNPEIENSSFRSNANKTSFHYFNGVFFLFASHAKLSRETNRLS